MIQCANATSSAAMAGRKRQLATTTDSSAAMTTGADDGSDSNSDSSDDSSDDSGEDGFGVCGFPGPITVTEGPSTIHYTMAFDSK